MSATPPQMLESRSLLISFGILFVAQNVALLAWSADLRGYSYLSTPLHLAKHLLIWYETRVTGTVGRLLLTPSGPWTLYYTMLALAGLAVAVALALRRTRWGYALIAIGADEERAETLGIATTRVKVTTFALSAAFMAASGGAMAPRWTYLDPQVFNPLVSFQTVIMALVGGASSVVGPVVGAVFLGLASELLLVQFRYLYMLALGGTLIAIVLFVPEGLTAGARRLAGRHRTTGS